MEEKTIHNETAIQDNKYIQYLTFMLGMDVYGIAVNIIREVNRYGKVFPVPKSPQCVSGIINLRGDVIPIIDLNTRLFGTESKITKFTNIIILEHEHEDEITQIGVIIDSVKEVVDIKDSDIENAVGFALNLRKDFVTGIGKVHESFIVLLDIPPILNVDEISQISSTSDRTDAASVLSANFASGDMTRNRG
jgi:purine-binding chemotaxis protein CheW